jgi:hypothetical protein
MTSTLNFATLVAITIFAGAAAFAFDWLLLRAMFFLMKPATARHSPALATAPTHLVRGTTQLVRAYTPHR